MAAEWSKLNKKKTYPKVAGSSSDRAYQPLDRTTKKPENDYYRPRERSSSRTLPRSERSDHRNGDEGKYAHKDSQQRFDQHRTTSRHESSYDVKNNQRETQINDVDEFGRVRTAGSAPASSNRSSSHRERRVDRSRSRSRSSSPVLRRREYDDGSRDDHRGRDRDVPRRSANSEWRHDLYNRNDHSPERPPVDAEYRPPSPTWVSKAGGVAIIRRK